MHEQEISLDLDDILRERIDDCAKWKRDIRKPETVVTKFLNDEELTEDEDKLLYDYLLSVSLKRFLEAKEEFVIPEDAAHGGSAKFLQILEHYKLIFAYQDFYAYQFVDMLSDVVRRAFLVRDVFAKESVPEKVKLACAEAYRCFLYGFNTASIALCRAIIEALLKLALGVDLGTLENLNDFALKAKRISPDTHKKIDTVRKDANLFVHTVSRGRKPSEKITLRIIELTQNILGALLSSGASSHQKS